MARYANTPVTPEFIQEYQIALEDKVNHLIALAESKSHSPYRTVVVNEDLVKSIGRSWERARSELENGTRSYQDTWHYRKVRFDASINTLINLITEMTYQIEGEWR